MLDRELIGERQRLLKKQMQEDIEIENIFDAVQRNSSIEDWREVQIDLL